MFVRPAEFVVMLLWQPACSKLLLCAMGSRASICHTPHMLMSACWSQYAEVLHVLHEALISCARGQVGDALVGTISWELGSWWICQHTTIGVTCF
jgi:hypothetical protein